MGSLNNSLGSIEGGEGEREESKCHLRALVKTTAMDREEEGGGREGQKEKMQRTEVAERAELISYSLLSPLLSQSSSGHPTTPSELNLFPIPKRSHWQSTELSPYLQIPFNRNHEVP